MLDCNHAKASFELESNSSLSAPVLARQASAWSFLGRVKTSLSLQAIATAPNQSIPAMTPTTDSATQDLIFPLSGPSPVAEGVLTEELRTELEVRILWASANLKLVEGHVEEASELFKRCKLLVGDKKISIPHLRSICIPCVGIFVSVMNVPCETFS